MTPVQIAENINNWDKQDVDQLRDMLADLNNACEREGVDPQTLVDMADLPSAEIPEGMDTSYPVWAIDAHGRCLVGDEANEIETSEEVMQ